MIVTLYKTGPENNPQYELRKGISYEGMDKGVIHVTSLDDHIVDHIMECTIEQVNALLSDIF